MLQTYLPWVALSLSCVATVFCWRRIILSADPAFFKALLAIVAVIPFIGPFMYAFTNMPSSLPENAMAKGGLHGTTDRSQITRELSEGYRRYQNQLYGVGAPSPGGKRKKRRSET